MAKSKKDNTDWETIIENILWLLWIVLLWIVLAVLFAKYIIC